MRSLNEAVSAFLASKPDMVPARLTTGSLRAFDAQVELAEHEPGRVAGDWLRAATPRTPYCAP
jgi:hypothetical protein